MNDQEFFEALHEVQERDNVEYLSIVAMMLFFVREQEIQELALYQKLQRTTRGDLKRAIKRLRQMQSLYEYPKDIDGTISFIRKEFLQK